MSTLIEEGQVLSEYDAIPTLLRFHNSGAWMRCIVGPVGSGKTTAAAWEVCHDLPFYIFQECGIRRTKWVVVRNTYRELEDTTMQTILEWFPFGNMIQKTLTYRLEYPKPGLRVDLLFRSCDKPADIKKFKSLEVTGFWIDESIEVRDDVKRMLKNRAGRYPKLCPVRFGIETTNPPEVEDPAYSQYRWIHRAPPGPVSPGKPLQDHEGFWQPPFENRAWLRPGYYEDLRADYRDNPDWIERYIEGKPGILVKGKQVYNNWNRKYNLAEGPISWMQGADVYMGWDNSGNVPAAVLGQVVSPFRLQVLREYWSDKMGITDFTQYVMAELGREFPGMGIKEHFGDPAGAAQFSKKDGGFTSNAELMEAYGVKVISADNNLTARITAVDRMLARRDGLLIDASCRRLVNGFIGGYCYPELMGWPGEFADKPIKNKYSHPHDALQYMLMSLFGAHEAKAEDPGAYRRLNMLDQNRRRSKPLRGEKDNGRSESINKKGIGRVTYTS